MKELRFGRDASYRTHVEPPRRETRHASSPFVSVACWPPRRPAAGALAGSVRTRDGTPLPQVVLDRCAGPPARARVVTGPEGRFRATGLAARRLHGGGRRARLRARRPRRASTVAAGEARLDLALAPAPVREQVVVTATRGEAAALHARRRASPSSTATRIAEPRGGARPAAAPGGARRGHGAHRRRRARRARCSCAAASRSYARVLVDGVPVNEPGGAYDFGSALPLELERVEVVRGAASSLYGTDALAGVVHLVTRRAAPASRARRARRGRGRAASTGSAARPALGRSGALRLERRACSASRPTTRSPTARFEQTAGARLAGRARSATARPAPDRPRARTATSGTPGQTAFGRPDLDATLRPRRPSSLGAHLRHGAGRAGPRAARGLRADRPALAEPARLGLLHARAGRARPAPFPFSDFPEPARLPERHRPPLGRATRPRRRPARATC